jgi:hypothetical protein
LKIYIHHDIIKRKKVTLKSFSTHFPYLDIKELIEQYAVFDGYENLEALHSCESLVENIKVNILQRYDELKSNFIYSDDENIQANFEKLLFRIGVGSRKIYSIYKDDISQFHGSSLYQELFTRGIIYKEFSREKPLKAPVKKEFRRYKIEDKIRFSCGFYRFWFTFVAPFAKEIEAKKYENVLEKISIWLDKYISLTFEELSNELINLEYDIVESGSYWDKHIELDMLARTNRGKVIAGEAKWKNQKISKNTLNKLQKKCELAKLNVDYYALFSKSGFSNELIKNAQNNILLFDINSFERLLHDR